MKKLIFLTLFLSIFIYAFAQDISGPWISSFEKRIQTEKYGYELFMDSYKAKRYKLDTIQIDTFYHEYNLILDFITGDKVVVKWIGRSEDECTYTKRENKIRINCDGFKLKGTLSDNQITLYEKHRNRIWNEIYLSRLASSNIEKGIVTNSNCFNNSSWVLAQDCMSASNYYAFHFLDSNRVIINYLSGERGYTSVGRFTVDTYNDHIFIGLMDNWALRGQTFLFDRHIGNSLIGYTYKHTFWGDEVPIKYNISFLKKDFISEERIDAMKSILNGTWIATNNPIPTDSMRYDSTSNQNLTINFNLDNEFEIISSGIVFKDGVQSDIEQSILGSWEIGKTGTYIILYPKDSYKRFVLIGEIRENSLVLYYTLNALGELTRLVGDRKILLVRHVK